MRHFATDYNGDQAYWVELQDFGMDRLYFECSLKIDLHSFPKPNKIIRIIIKKDFSKQAREMFIHKLFIEISRIPGIQKYYFRKEELNKYGQYIDQS